MDFSPIRPDDWMTTYADTWSYYIQFRNAFDEGCDEVRADFAKDREEQRAKKERQREIDRKSEEFWKAHGAATF